MKKIRLVLLVLMFCLFVSGCGCEKQTKNFTVTFASNSDSVVEAQIVKENGVVTKPDEPTKDGYTFDGWYLSLADEKAYDFSTKITKNIILYAKWSSGTGDKKCTITCEEGYQLNEDSCKCEKKPNDEKNINVKSVSLNTTSANLVIGETLNIKAKINPSNATNQTVTWKSSNNKVVTVKNGKVTAVGEGSATITATVGGKKATAKINVSTKDEFTLSSALSSMNAKTLTKGNTDINYTYDGCTITNTGNIASNNTDVSIGKVNKLYRDTTKGSIKSTYNVVCGAKSATKTLTHTIAASTYTYTADYNGILYIIKVANAKDYTLTGNLKYLAAAGGAQTGNYDSGTVYEMIFNNDASTVYKVKAN